MPCAINTSGSIKSKIEIAKYECRGMNGRHAAFLDLAIVCSTFAEGPIRRIMNAIEDVCTIMENNTHEQDACTCYDNGETCDTTNQEASTDKDTNSATIWIDWRTEKAHM